MSVDKTKSKAVKDRKRVKGIGLGKSHKGQRGRLGGWAWAEPSKGQRGRLGDGSNCQKVVLEPSERFLVDSLPCVQARLYQPNFKKIAGARFKGILTSAYLMQHHGLFRQRTKHSDSDKFYAPTSPLQVYSGVLNEKIFNLDFLLALINDYWSLFDSHRVFFAIWLIINFHWKVLSEPS